MSVLDIFYIFCTETFFVGTHGKHLSEAIPVSIHTIGLGRN